MMSPRDPATSVAIFLTCALMLALAGCGSSSPRFTGKPTMPEGWENEPLRLEGTASYYAEEFHGRQTSNGETYDMNSLTAAHRTLPFNTQVRVTNLSNGKSVVVRINDRGPFKEERIIDLSLEAAKTLGMIQSGTAPVRLAILGQIPPEAQPPDTPDSIRFR